MANTKITSNVIANDAVTVDMITDAAVTADKLHATLDLSGKTLTLPSSQAATTQSASDNTTKVATTAYVTTAIANLSDSAPAALNTLNEIAAALGDDANYAATTTAAIATKLPLAGGTLTGNLVLSGAPTSGLHPATKTYTDTADALKLNLSGGTLTGDLILNTTTALKIPAGTTAQRPSAATGQLRWNTSDGALEVYNGSAWTAVGTGSSNKILDTFTGDNSTTDFTLSVTPANEDALIVFIDGVYQEKGDYTLTNAVLALDTAPASGEKIAVHITTASVHDGTSAVNQQFTATAGQTAFTLSADPKSENNTQVYINGVYQQKTDYTVSGTTLTFDTGLTVGDVVEVNSFTVTTLGNTDTVSEGTSNLYHTDARARGAISVSGNALSYNSSTGVITSAYEESPSFTGTVSVAGNISSGGVFKLSSHRSTYVDASEDSTANSHMFVTNDGVGDFSQEAGHLVIQARTHTSVYRDIIFAGGINNASDLMRITGEGNVLIGGTNPAPVSNNVAGVSIRNFGEVQSSVDGAPALYLNRKTNDGALAYFRKDGGTIGALATAGGDLIIGSHNTCLRFDDSADDILPTDDAGIVVNNTLSLGSSSARFKELWVGSSALDDYEEGTFTPTISAGSGSITLDSGENLASYTKIGRMVYITGRLLASSVSSPSGSLQVTNLPFTVLNLGENSPSSPVVINFYNLTSNVDGEVTAEMSTSNSILIRDNGGTTGNVQNSMASHIGNGSRIGFTAVYVTSQ